MPRRSKRVKDKTRGPAPMIIFAGEISKTKVMTFSKSNDTLKPFALHALVGLRKTFVLDVDFELHH